MMMKSIVCNVLSNRTWNVEWNCYTINQIVLVKELLVLEPQVKIIISSNEKLNHLKNYQINKTSMPAIHFKTNFKN